MGSPIQWERQEDHVAVTSILGQKGGCLEDWESGICGVFLLQDEEGRYDGTGLQVTEFESQDTRARIRCAGRRLSMSATYAYDEASDVWSRRDVLVNPTGERQRVRSCLSRFVFSGHDLEVYCQSSSWNQENQGDWQTVPGGGVTITCKGLRTTEGATPYAALRNRLTGRGSRFICFPWESGYSKSKRNFPTAVRRTPCWIWGYPMMAWIWPWSRGKSWSFQRSSFIPLRMWDWGRINCINMFYPITSPNGFPLWCSTRGSTTTATWTRRNCWSRHARAKALGCEVFVIDAGWFGESEQWHSETGCWYENTVVAFRGKMKEFADSDPPDGPGFWHLDGAGARDAKGALYQEHPEYFFEVDGGYVADLSKPWVQDRIFAQIGELIETYGLRMMKIDFNVGVSYDQSRCNFYRYYQGLYGMLDRLRAKYPHVVFEGCSSGGQRSDLNTIRHFDFHFISDTVHPREVLRIYQGALLRLPPGCLSKRAVIRSGDPLARPYNVSTFEGVERLYARADATWDRTMEVDLDYSMAIGFCGVLGLSTDLARLSDATKKGIQRWISFYKEKRDFLQGAVCYQLTAPAGMEDIMSPAVFQLKAPDETGCLLIAFRMEDSRDGLLVRPKELDASTLYTVIQRKRRGGKRAGRLWRRESGFQSKKRTGPSSWKLWIERRKSREGGGMDWH
ncbi:MAG: glycoside hydrolase family 36 protein [Clostridia bacterium]